MGSDLAAENIFRVVLCIVVGFVLCLILAIAAPGLFMPEPDLVMTVEDSRISCYKVTVSE